MGLRDIPGQEKVIAPLLRALEQGAVNHAYLFSGPEGVGKEAASVAWAQALNCLRPIEGDACGGCPACIRVREGESPDIIKLAPGETVIKIEQVRQLERFLNFKRYEELWKVVLIRDAEKITLEAGNALLRHLEDPPQGTVFVLASSNSWRLLPTIRSRCHRINFLPLKTDLVAKALEDEGTGKDRALFLAGLCGGNKALALEIAKSIPSARDKAYEVLCLLQKGERDKFLDIAEEICKHPFSLGVLYWLALWFRDLAVWRETGLGKLICNRDWMEELGSLWPLDTNSLLSRVNEVMHARRNLEENVNPSLVWEVLLLRLRSLEG